MVRRINVHETFQTINGTIFPRQTDHDGRWITSLRGAPHTIVFVFVLRYCDVANQRHLIYTV